MTITTEKSKEIVLAFYERYNARDVEGAVSYLGETYMQHNPWVTDGPEGFRRFVTFLRDNFPDGRNEVKRVIAEHDIVCLHVHSRRVPGETGRAIMDVFRVDERGKIVEHWDVIQAIPDNIYPPVNDNGYF
ncbi:polyketide cyclase [Pseudoclavibacter endophyticus]|uniref:Polyketide cyclase n=1 Tax=Pseudoclavibacter endophyticus TaxID=1778590 RepID=A0A6H9WPR3_9MICO|nr:nuclear transport factor 2 family protein [Pseudoclavibacter endophyticus]KAB1648967.1 polyketide cyclase [Pseudoclavibacter endophyticus]GGA66678.1 polyketide cyclase [Pseudoclavibacter endophyticus]